MARLTRWRSSVVSGWVFFYSSRRTRPSGRGSTGIKKGMISRVLSATVQESRGDVNPSSLLESTKPHRNQEKVRGLARRRCSLATRSGRRDEEKGDYTHSCSTGTKEAEGLLGEGDNAELGSPELAERGARWRDGRPGRQPGDALAEAARAKAEHERAAWREQRLRGVGRQLVVAGEKEVGRG
ncbi:hypothetical protein J5N97_022497 [Dioscorea zingiberensis]|uniref:Uncharacterized protein n=1 Tax=Dioscorea zingiberensis TaxID=325984 RepID=A0A9D5CBB4_9LILI|nr:hypothetical protein J5N97_022497 [Dioscorea zingiberensis]